MIKLDRTTKPAKLTAELQKRLTDKFKVDGKPVWNKSFIKRALLNFSHDKCCYCEMNIKEESKYLEVEHFHHKDKYKDEVLEWENLLPACKKCNGAKGKHDTKNEPIIDPCKINPKNHLGYWRYRIKGLNQLGKLTISVLNLNDQDRLVRKRFEVGDAIQNKLEQLNELIDDYASNIQTSTIRKNRIINGTKDVMKEGLPSSIYSAITATIILTDTEFISLKKKLLKLNFWDEEFIELECGLSKVALDLYD